jgi:hypothetical protein
MAKLNPEEQRKRNWRRTVIDDGVLPVEQIGDPLNCGVDTVKYVRRAFGGGVAAAGKAVVDLGEAISGKPEAPTGESNKI